MIKGKHAVIGLLALLLLTCQSISMQDLAGNANDVRLQPSGSTSVETNHGYGPKIEREKSFALSQEPVDGILDPVNIKQSGVYVSQNRTGMIDSANSEMTNITIDEENGWVASGARIDAWNLKRLYLENGAFGDGTSGWINSTYDSDGRQTPSTDYNSTGGHVTAKNIAYNNQPVQNVWTHYAFTEALWSQTINNTPLATEFALNLRFLYANGPLDPLRNDFLEGHVYLAVFFDDSGWGRDMVTLPTRDEWNTWEINLNPTWVGSTFDFDVGLFIASDTVLDADLDYDDDGSPDGTNVTTIEILIDDVSLESVNPISFNQVDMVFHAGSQSESIVAEGSEGSATISNPTLWTQSPLVVEISSTLSVSFDYRISLDSHRYTNSSYVADPTKWGVSYLVESGQSPELALYMYIGTTEYANLTLEVFHPVDWENATVLNPFLNDVTSQCTVVSGSIEIPNALLDRLGWWKVELQAPNYAKNVKTQLYEQSSGLWSNSDTYWTSNQTRVQVEVGTIMTTPTLNDPINVTWLLPDDSPWVEESLTGGIAGVVNGTSWTLGPLNTSAGLWTLAMVWSNGTEVAYGITSMGVYHSAKLNSLFPEVETDVGFLLTNFVNYTDAENGEYLMDDSATIVANWSGTSIPFTPNLVRNWWEADFDTSLIHGGRYVVQVNASRPYFLNVSCQFVIIATHQTGFQLTSVGGLPTETGLHEILTVQMEYEYLNGTGITGATIDMSFTGPTNGLSLLGQSSTIPGNYSIDLTSSMSGIYTVTITASKAYHHNKTDSFTLIVGETGTQLTILNGTADFLDMGGTYRLVLRYANSTDDGIETANVTVISVTPSAGLGYSVVSHEGNGFYSLVLTPSASGTYTLIMRANLTNHVTQIVSFTLTASDIATVLTIDSPGANIGVLESLSVQLTLVDEYSNGVPGATLSVLNPPAGLNFLAGDLTGGVYNLTITGSTPGTYQLAIRASKTNYLNSTVGFTIIVRGYASIFTVMNGTADYVTYGDSYRLLLRYTNGTGFGLSGASIEIIDRTPSFGVGDLPPIDEGNGYYSITLTPTTSNIFSILIKANLSVYITQIVSFSLTVREISTILTLDHSGATISVDQNHLVQLTFRDESLNGLAGATILVLNPPVGLAYSILEASGGQYNLTLTPSMIGTYEFAIRATLSNYLNSTVGFTLVVRTIPTELRIVEGLTSDSTYFTEKYNLTLVYIRTDTGQNISSADLAISTLPAEGLTISLSKIGDLYYLSFETDSIGKWQVFFTANKTDHVSGFTEFELEVLPVAIEINIIRGLSEVEGVQNTLSLWLIESATGNPVSGATIEYQLIRETGPGEIQPMTESDPGLYSASFQMPSFEATTYVRIYVTIENYEVAADYYEIPLVPILSEIEALNRTIRFYSPFIAFLGIAAIAYAGRRSYIKKQRIRNIEAMIVKRRFDDIKSLLGVIVLHKYTGIPVYSKMMKEGLDESLVSGFVSAISTFRGEFEVNQENWVVTPISDIMRTVATENLICAFVSLAPPSKSQELRMVEFAEAIGFVFDNMYTEAPAMALDQETEAQFDAFFDDIMDGRFLRDYKVSEIKSFPRKTKCIVERIHRIDDEDGFDLDELAIEMTSCGFEEARVYAIIMDAIEMGNLVLTSIDEMRARELSHITEKESAIIETEPEIIEEESTIIEAEPEPEDPVTIREEPTIIEAKPEFEGPEPTSEPEFTAKEDDAETSEEEKFLEDIENLLSEENDRDE